MGIWIRTQNGIELLQVTKLEIDITYQNSILVGFDFYGKRNDLGYYKNRERALEILDEIEKIMQVKAIMKFNYMLRDDVIEKEKKKNKDFFVIDNKADIIPFPQTNIIYKMPKE